MNLRRFSYINLQRCNIGFKHKLTDWSYAEWTNAIAGEAGEACNVTKKLLRLRDNLAGNTKPGEDDEGTLKRKAARELADVIIYADLTMQALGFSTSDVVVAVFNEKSRQLGCDITFEEGPRESRLDGKVYGELYRNKDGKRIPDDEFIAFRPQDNALPATLEFYYQECKRLGADEPQLEAIVELADRVLRWRKANPNRCKVPDVDPGEITILPE